MSVVLLDPWSGAHMGEDEREYYRLMAERGEMISEGWSFPVAPRVTGPAITRRDVEALRDSNLRARYVADGRQSRYPDAYDLHLRSVCEVVAASRREREQRVQP